MPRELQAFWKFLLFVLATEGAVAGALFTIVFAFPKALEQALYYPQFTNPWPFTIFLLALSTIVGCAAGLIAAFVSLGVRAFVALAGLESARFGWMTMGLGPLAVTAAIHLFLTSLYSDLTAPIAVVTLGILAAVGAALASKRYTSVSSRLSTGRE